MSSPEDSSLHIPDAEMLALLADIRAKPFPSMGELIRKHIDPYTVVMNEAERDAEFLRWEDGTAGGEAVPREDARQLAEAGTLEPIIDISGLPSRTPVMAELDPWEIADVPEVDGLATGEAAGEEEAAKSAGEAAAEGEAAAKWEAANKELIAEGKNPKDPATRPGSKSTAQAARDEAWAAFGTAKRAAGTVEDNYFPQAVEERDRARKAEVRDGWVQDLADDQFADAKEASAVVAEELKEAEAAYNRADAALRGNQPRAALAAAREARAAADSATEAKLQVAAARNSLQKTAGVLPPIDFEDVPEEGVPSLKERYLHPPDGYRLPTGERERFERMGNNPTFPSLWIATDPDSDKPEIWHHKSKRDLKPVYTAGYQLMRERIKWARVEKFREVSEALKDELRATIHAAKNSQDPKVLADRDNALALLLTQITGMRRGSSEGMSFIKDPDDAEYRTEVLKGPDGKVVKDADGKPRRVPAAQIPTYGASTLLRKHLTFEKDARGRLVAAVLRFRGKAAHWNKFRVEDPDVVAALAEAASRVKRGGKLFPRANGTAMSEFMDTRIREIGKREGIKEATGFVDNGDDGEADAPGPDLVDGGGGTDDEDLTGGFGIHDMRRLMANTVAPEIFEKILRAKGLPKDVDEFTDWVSIASLAASKQLNNEYATFILNYLSMLPFRGVIDAMIAEEKKKPPGQRGPLDPEDYWRFGKKTVPALKGKPVAAVLGEELRKEKGPVVGDG